MRELRNVLRSGVIALVLLAGACAGPSLRPVTEEQAAGLRQRLGTPGVIGAYASPQTDYLSTSRGETEALMAGKTSGLLALLGSLEQAGGYGAVLSYVVVPPSLAATPGAQPGSPAPSLADRQAALRKALAELRIQDRLRNALADQLHLLHVPAELLGEDDLSPQAFRKSDYRQLKSTGIDTVVEASVERLVFVGNGWVGPDLSLRLEARVRLVSTADNGELFSRSYACGSRQDRIMAWAGMDGKPVEDEIGRCSEVIAERAARDLATAGTGAP